MKSTIATQLWVDTFCKIALYVTATLAFLVVILGLSTHLYLFTSFAYDSLTNRYSHNPYAHEFSAGIISFFLGNDSALPPMNTHESLHMYDVRSVIAILSFLYVISIFCVLWIPSTLARRASLNASILISVGSLLAFILPFEKLFALFHVVFFAQASWLFPANSILLVTYPQEFFAEFFMLIMSTALALSLAILAIHSIVFLRTRMLEHNKP